MSDGAHTFMSPRRIISKRKAGLHEHSLRRTVRSGAFQAPPWRSRLTLFYRGSDHKRFPSRAISALWERVGRSRLLPASRRDVRPARAARQRETTMPTRYDTTEPPQHHRGRKRGTVEEESKGESTHTSEVTCRRSQIAPWGGGDNRRNRVRRLLTLSTPSYSLYHGSRRREGEIHSTEISLPPVVERRSSPRWSR